MRILFPKLCYLGGKWDTLSEWFVANLVIANDINNCKNSVFIERDLYCELSGFFYVRCNNLDSSVKMYWRYQSKTLGHSYKRYWVLFSNSSHSSHCDGVKIISHWCHILNTTWKKRSQYYVFYKLCSQFKKNIYCSEIVLCDSSHQLPSNLKKPTKFFTGFI